MIAKNTITFWDKVIFDQFEGVDGVAIKFACITKQSHTKTLVIIPGRGESYTKYHDVIFSFYNKAYNVYILDHRGQGHSGRLLDNKNKGYVKKFQDYVDDLTFFVNNIVMKQNINKPYLLAHSMGGAIATRFMQDHPESIQAAVLSCPMLAFNTGILPKSIAKMLVNTLVILNTWLGSTPWYFLGQKDYKVRKFSDNKLTHSTSRYHNFITLYNNTEALQLGGVTSHWLKESVNAQRVIFSDLQKLTTPIIVFTASADKIVCPKAQYQFCQALHAVAPLKHPLKAPIVFRGAYHELFFEIDEYRNQAINNSLDWFRQN